MGIAPHPYFGQARLIWAGYSLSLILNNPRVYTMLSRTIATNLHSFTDPRTVLPRSFSLSLLTIAQATERSVEASISEAAKSTALAGQTVVAWCVRVRV